jgi:hypothetical protein
MSAVPTEYAFEVMEVVSQPNRASVYTVGIVGIDDETRERLREELSDFYLEEAVVGESEGPEHPAIVALREFVQRDLDNDKNNLNESMAGIRRGDLVVLAEAAGYRNDGKFIYDGERIVPLAFDADEYGHLPPAFLAITEFEPMHWHSLICHNSYVYADFGQLEIRWNDYCYHADGTYVFFGEVCHGDREFGVFYPTPNKPSTTLPRKMVFPQFGLELCEADNGAEHVPDCIYQAVKKEQNLIICRDVF